MPQVNHFTQAWLQAVKSTMNRRVDYWETATPGFGLRVTPTGVKTWFYWYRFKGRAKRWTLGRYPAITLADARDQARKAYGHNQRVGKPSDVTPRRSQSWLASTYRDMRWSTRKRGRAISAGSST